MALITLLHVTYCQCGRSKIRMNNNTRFNCNYTMPLHIAGAMHNSPVDSGTYLQPLHTCITDTALSQGKQIHSLITHRGFAFATPTFIQNNLINMYVKCGTLVDARKLFDEMTERDSYSWNLIIAAYRRQGYPQEALILFHQMQRTGAQPDQFTFSSVLPACAKIQALEQGIVIHQSIIESRFLSDIVVTSALIDMYGKCGGIHKARKVFDKMPERNVVSWNAMIAGYAQNGALNEALGVFKDMPQRDVVSWNAMIAGYAQYGILDEALRLFKEMPQRDVVSWNTMIAAYAQNGVLDKALGLFTEMPQRNVVSWNAMIAGYAQNGILHEALRLFKEMPLRNVISWNAMTAAYAQNGFLDDALRLFKKMPRRDVVSWNAMIAAYGQNGLDEKALETFKQMQLTDVKPNSTTFASILPVCAKMGALEQGLDIHQRIIESEFSSEVVVASALVDMYAKCGSIRKAWELFDKMPYRNVVSWNAMIAGCAQNGLVEKALEIFKQMQIAGINPNSTTFASTLPACAKIGALEQGMDIHQSIIESGFLSDVVVASALVDMYAKCGSIQKARELFDATSQRDAVLWNAMTAGYAMHGFCKDALKLFELMKHSGTYPDHVSFICILFACSHAGLVDEGCKYFNGMTDSYYIVPTMDHYVCMVDLLGRAGYLEEAQNFIFKMSIKPAAIVWMCLLSACKSHKNLGLGLFTATLLFELDPKNDVPYVLLSNIYAEVGRWGDVQKVRGLMKDRGIKKTPGCSCVEVHKMVHAFCVGDRFAPAKTGDLSKVVELSG